MKTEGFSINVDPQQKKKFKLEKFPILNTLTENILEISLIQNKETDLISVGHEIGWDQFIINKGKRINDSALVKNDLEIVSSDIIEIKNQLVSLKIDSKTGEIISWLFEGKEITNQPIKPNFWRPPTDNDLGNGMPKWAKIWQDATYNYQAELAEKPKPDGIGVTYKVNYKLPNDEATVSAIYTLISNGILEIDVNFKPNKIDLPNIPRLGMYLTLSNKFTNTNWYGNGPSESYWDRKTGVKYGIFSAKIDTDFHRYPRPQETGNKTDVRWVQVSSDKLLLTASSQTTLLNTSVWPFDIKELDFNIGDAGKSASGLVPVTKKHGADIQIGKSVQWNIDYLQMGVGGDTSWGRLVHDEYTIKPKNYQYSFTIKPSLK